MFKRFQQKYANVKDNKELREDLSFMPSPLETLHPDASPEKLEKLREEYDFEGDFHCNLCPNKLILNERDLKLHVESKLHKKNLELYYKKNKKIVIKRLRKLSEKSMRDSIFATPKY